MPPEELIEIVSQYQGRAIGFRADLVRIPELGVTATREYLIHPGGVVIVPILDDGRVILVRQYRYAVQQYTLELPAGKLEVSDSDLVAAAHRELQEETGYTASGMQRLGSIYPTPAFSTEILHLFRATELQREKQHLDSDEAIDLLTITLPEAYQLLSASPITDAKTLLGLLLASQA